MAIAITSPITGGAQTGLTSPTYTVVADTAQGLNGKQVAVSAFGGTQATVTTSTVASPFTLSVYRALNLRVLGTPNPITGILNQVPKNVHTLITRKGVTVLSGQAIQTLLIETKISVPAGSETADPANIRAALSAHIGLLDQQSSGLGDMCVLGVI